MIFKLLLLKIYIIGYLLMSASVSANSLLEQAYSNYKNEDYLYAKILYSNSFGYQARMGEGNSAYRLNDYKSAIKQYTLALLKAKNNNDKYKSLYNLANAYYKDEAYIKAIETYKYLLKFNSKSEQAQGNLWSAQSMLIDKIKNKKLFSDKETTNYENPEATDDTILDKDEKITQIEKIGYLRTLIGDRVAEGELIAIANNHKSINILILKARQIKNYLSALKKIEFVNDNPSLILKQIIRFEIEQNKK